MFVSNWALKVSSLFFSLLLSDWARSKGYSSWYWGKVEAQPVTRLDWSGLDYAAVNELWPLQLILKLNDRRLGCDYSSEATLTCYSCTIFQDLQSCCSVGNKSHETYMPLVCLNFNYCCWCDFNYCCWWNTSFLFVFLIQNNDWNIVHPEICNLHLPDIDNCKVLIALSHE